MLDRCHVLAQEGAALRGQRWGWRLADVRVPRLALEWRRQGHRHTAGAVLLHSLINTVDNNEDAQDLL